MSSRPFLCTWNMYYYQQRCVYKISNQKIPHVNIITPIKSSIIYIHNRIVPPYMTFVVMTTYNHWGVSKIYFQNIMCNVTRIDKFLNSSIIVGFPKYFLSIFPLGGDTPFCAFGYEIIDFYLTRKKTGRRYGRQLRFSTIKPHQFAMII